MRFIIDESGNFNVSELVTDSAGAKITSGKTIELRIWERDSMNMYDWDDGTFKAAGIVDDEDVCSHQQAGGTYDTGNWKNDTAIDYTAFTSGEVYVFEFVNLTDGELISQREVQFGGNYGDNLPEIVDISGLNDPTAAAVADAVWDEAKSGHTAAGSFGEEAQSHATPSEVNAQCDAALTDYDAPTKTEMDAGHAIITAAIAALNNLSSAQATAACASALGTYDPPTKAEMDAAFAALNDPTINEIADGFLNRTGWTKGGTTAVKTALAVIVARLMAVAATTASGDDHTSSYKEIDDSSWERAVCTQDLDGNRSDVSVKTP